MIITELLHGLTDLEFLSELKNKFSLLEEDNSPVRPRLKGEFSVYLSQKWYLFAPVNRKTSGNPVEDLDVSFLSDHVFEPILGIHDQRKDERIDFVGGIRGLEELSRRVDSGEMRLHCPLSGFDGRTFGGRRRRRSCLQNRLG